MGIRDILSEAFYSLGRNINKRSGDANQETAEGVVGARLPELSLEMDEDEMVDLSDKWEKAWNDSDVKSKWEAAGTENEKYWKGEHYDRAKIESSRPVVDNAIYEGLETYLPQVTRRNPEAMVDLAVGVEETPANQQFATALKLELGELADDLKLRLKLKGAARHHELRLLGAIKLGWDVDNDRPALKVVRPTRLILDPNATVDEDGYTGDRIGEHRKLPAWKLARLIEDTKGSEESQKAIKEACKDNMATEIGFIEWWTPEYFFWKMGKVVLLKRKNPHWNYEPEQPAAAPEAPQPVGLEQPELPAGGPAIPALPQAPQMQPAPAPKAVNHFVTPRMPFVLLSIANLGQQPVNVTSNIGQNLANQDLINKRIKQIDRNADNANNGLVVSLERAGLNADQAKRVATVLRAGGVVGIPSGSPQEAVWKPPMGELPVYIYNQLVDTRNRVRDIWGTRGSSPAGQTDEKTVRGKYLNKQSDADRIGGGLAEYLEQTADDLYNWLVQLLYVYDDRFVAAIAQGTPIPKIKISVKEGSLLPNDSMTIANQAIDLATQGKMSLIDMYKRLDYPNPEEMAANVWLEANAPELLFGNDERVKQVIAARQNAKTQEKPPNESINFKDLPPEGKSQMAAKVGIQLHPEGIAAHDAHLKSGEGSAPVPALPAVGT